MDYWLYELQRYCAKGGKVGNLAHLLDVPLLMECFQELDPKKAPGVDGVTKAKYGKSLAENLQNLVSRMKDGSYTPQPSRRKYIDKPGSTKKRPLGISCLEDKILENAIAKILNVIFDPTFCDFSHGF